MDKIHEGWMTKSPPDWKKHMSIFKLKKWRRRYFVLYSPPVSCIVPGTCEAQLCYYENESLSKECGRIDLKQCEEITSQLETDDHRHVLALETVSKNQARIYYLAADTEEDLENWLERISYVLSLSGDEFVETNRPETDKSQKKPTPKSKSKHGQKSSSEKPRTKLSGVSLRRSSSTLSKSSTSINLLVGSGPRQGNRSLTGSGHSPNFSPSAPSQVRYAKLSSSQSTGDNLSLMAVIAGGGPAGALGLESQVEPDSTRAGIRSKPSFLNKIKQLKSGGRRPSCPLIIPSQQSQFCADESPCTATNVLRPGASKHAHQTRFQGSSGSSVVSFVSDYKTPDVTSPSTMPPLFYQALRKFEMNESALRIEHKFSLFFEPPPLPPKIRSSDSGLPDETGTSVGCPIYDVPVHKYGSPETRKQDGDEDGEEEEEEETEALIDLIEGVCLSVVDEREDEGLENDLDPEPNLDECRERILESIPPPLPERRRACADKTRRDSSDSDYDAIPFVGRVSEGRDLGADSKTHDSAPREKSSDDSSSNYDYIPMGSSGRGEPPTTGVERDRSDTPPPLPARPRKPEKLTELLGGSGGRVRCSSTSADSLVDIYDIVNEGDKLPEDDDDDDGGDDDDDDDAESKGALPRKGPVGGAGVDDEDPAAWTTLPKVASRFQKKRSRQHRTLLRYKSKSMENMHPKKRESSELSTDECRKSTSPSLKEGAKMVRPTFKTRSFKKKSSDGKDNSNESSSPSSPSDSSSSSSSNVHVGKPLVVNDHSLY